MRKPGPNAEQLRSAYGQGCRRLHQSLYAISVYKVKLGPGGAANCAGAMHHGIDAMDQASETFQVSKVTIYPLYGNVSRLLGSRCGAQQSLNLPTGGCQPPR